MKKLFIIAFIILSIKGKSQTIPVGSLLDDQLKTLQIEGKLDPKYSLTSRPFLCDKTLTYDTLLQLSGVNTTDFKKAAIKKNSIFQIYPATMHIVYNSHHPYGWNNSGMIDAKSFQTMVSAGFFYSKGIFSAQFIPQFDYAVNPNFEHSDQYGADTKGPYKKFFWGQSSVRVNHKALSLGLSTENMWWGPGSQNSLLMSNNAPGFLHLTLNTRYPIKTGIGNFEFQFISGKLTEDTSVLLENKDLTTYYYNQGTYDGGPADPKTDSLNWRYINGLNIVYSPKWIQNLSLGFNRVGYVYNTYLHEGKAIYNYLPALTGLFRGSSSYGNGSSRLKQILSLYFRYLMPKSHFEIYGELGYHDNTHNLRDFMMNLNHATAFTLGLKKMYNLKSQKQLIVETEITKLSQPIDNIQTRLTGYWYMYQGGYTNQNRILGAGYGLGSNIQFVGIKLRKNINELELNFQRIMHDVTPSPSYLGTTILNRPIQWQDFSFGLCYERQIKHLLVNFSIKGIYSENYAWLLNKTIFNNNTNIRITYIF